MIKVGSMHEFYACTKFTLHMKVTDTHGLPKRVRDVHELQITNESSRNE